MRSLCWLELLLTVFAGWFIWPDMKDDGTPDHSRKRVILDMAWGMATGFLAATLSEQHSPNPNWAPPAASRVAMRSNMSLQPAIGRSRGVTVVRLRF